MRYWQRYQSAWRKGHAVTRRCRRCEQHYETLDQDSDNLCLRCLHDRDFEQRVAEWFLKNAFARFEVYSIFDEDRVRVILNMEVGIGLNSRRSTRCTSRRYGGRRY